MFLLLGISMPATAIEKGEAKYAGGTAPGMSSGIVGRLDTTSATVLIVEFSAGRLAIPYAAIDSFEYSQEVKHHLGVLPAIAVALVKQRQRKHLFRISYRDENDVSQVVILEVAKYASSALEGVLKIKAPQACKPHAPCNLRR
jgi:hypothetical protein